MWGRLAALVVLSGLTVVLLRGGLGVDQTLHTIGVVCLLSIVTGLAVTGLAVDGGKVSAMLRAALAAGTSTTITAEVTA